jgi:hypothetical protein
MAARKKQTFSGQARSWAPAFLAAFRNTLNVRAAAEAAGIVRNTVYQYLAQNEEFRVAFEEARSDAVDMIAARALQKVLAGESDVLTIYLLKVHGGPEYRNDQRRTQEQTFDERQVRAMAQALADKYGVSADEIQQEAEAIAREAWSTTPR